VYAPGRPGLLGDVAAAHPDLTLVVDHCALGHDPATLEHWDGVLALERHPNVYLKTSFFPEAPTGEGYPFPRAQGLMREVYERFGADRLMWGSNFPVVLKATSYERAFEFVRRECAFDSLADRDKILGGTASRVLSLPW
jgi:predicted TIM-barrel fold metal-dependent hydrolase